jgi:hypothetical protein
MNYHIATFHLSVLMPLECIYSVSLAVHFTFTIELNLFQTWLLSVCLKVVHIFISYTYQKQKLFISYNVLHLIIFLFFFDFCAV